MNQIFHHWSRVATDCTSWDYPVCTRDTLWRQHYVRSSKEYLINCDILLQYFELVFFQLQLVHILCKLVIIWVNYEKNKKGFFIKHRVLLTVWCVFLLFLIVCIFAKINSYCHLKCNEFCHHSFHVWFNHNFYVVVKKFVTIFFLIVIIYLYFCFAAAVGGLRCCVVLIFWRYNNILHLLNISLMFSVSTLSPAAPLVGIEQSYCEYLEKFFLVKAVQNCSDWSRLVRSKLQSFWQLYILSVCVISWHIFIIFFSVL